MNNARKYARTGRFHIQSPKKKKKKEKRKRRKDQEVAMHLRSTLLSQVDGTSSDEDAQTFHSTGETCQ